MNKLLRFSVTVICVCSVFAGCEKNKSIEDSVSGLWAGIEGYFPEDGWFQPDEWINSAYSVQTLVNAGSDGILTFYKCRYDYDNYEDLTLPYANGIMVGGSLEDYYEEIEKVEYKFEKGEVWIGGFFYGDYEFWDDETLYIESYDGEDAVLKKVKGFQETSDDIVLIPDLTFAAYLVANYDSDGNGIISPDEAEQIEEMVLSPDRDSYYSPILDLTGVESMSNLKVLIVQGFSINSLDISHCSSLTQLDCSDSSLESLDASYCTSLIQLDHPGGYRLQNLDISNCSSLTQLDCSNGSLKSLDISYCTSLTQLNCSYNDIQDLNLNDCNHLIELLCPDNRLENLDISNCDRLTRLDCAGNPLNSIYVTEAQSKADWFIKAMRDGGYYDSIVKIVR